MRLMKDKKWLDIERTKRAKKNPSISVIIFSVGGLKSSEPKAQSGRVNK